jgi:hypothetical protein
LVAVQDEGRGSNFFKSKQWLAWLLGFVFGLGFQPWFPALVSSLGFQLWLLGLARLPRSDNNISA